MFTFQSVQTRAPAAFLLLGIIGGLVAAGIATAPIPLLLGVAFVAACLSIHCLRSERASAFWWIAFLLAAISGAWAYGQMRLPAEPPPDVLALPKREAALTLRVERILQAGGPFGSVSGLARVENAPKVSRLAKRDQVYFRLGQATLGDFPIERGLTFQATGLLTPITAEQALLNEFDDYLKTTGVHYRFERGENLLRVQAPGPFARFCTRTNARFQEYLRLGAPENSEVANVYVAMLLGRKTELSDVQSDRFRMSGTMHFFAISGLHIGVIAAVIAQFLFLLRVPRSIAPLIGLPLLYLYVEITGGAPSAVRAFLMAAFFWVSLAFRRQRAPFCALVGSAVGVLIIAPSNLWSVGFQLSYAVVCSILLFGLPLYQALSERGRTLDWLPEANWSRSQRIGVWTLDKVYLLFAISFSAWLASSPLSAGTFGFISPGGVLLNMLLVYFASLVIIGGVLSLGFAIIGATWIAAFINHSAWMLLQAMDFMVATSLRIPGAILHCDGFPGFLAYGSLALYFGVLCWLHLDPGKLRDYRMLYPPAVILAALVIGVSLQ